MVASPTRDACNLCVSSLRHLGAMLHRYCLARLVLSCGLRLASVVWRSHSIPSGAGSASAATHHHSGSSELHLGRVPTIVRHDRRRGFGQVSASLHTSLCTPLACKPVRALMLTVCSGWLAGRMVRAHYGLPCLGAVLYSLRVIVHPCTSFILEGL